MEGLIIIIAYAFIFYMLVPFSKKPYIFYNYNTSNYSSVPNKGQSSTVITITPH